MYTTIEDPNSSTSVLGDATTANGINDSGQIVGNYYDSSTIHGFLVSGGTYTTIDFPGAVAGSANAINDSGQIVGDYGDGAGGEHGYLLSGGQFTTIDVPGAVGLTAAEGINASGQIVGYYVDSGGSSHGFLLSDGKFTTIDFPTGTNTQALGINDSGQIVGTYDSPDGTYHGFLLSTADIKATPLSFASDGSLDYGYQITGGDLPEATTVDLYWAGGTTTDTEIGAPIATTTTDTAQGTYPLQVSASDLADRPEGAKYLLAVADPDNVISPADPSKDESLALPVIEATPLSFASDGGVDYGYQITGADLPEATTVDLYWAGGTTPDTEVGDPIDTTTTDTAQGTYPLQVSASDLADRPDGAKYLLAVADPDNLISPADPSKVQTLALANIEATPLSFASDGSLNYGYQITGGDLPEATTVDLYWAGGPTTDTEIGNPIATTTTDTAQGTYALQEPRSSLDSPPEGTKYLLVVADPDNLISPADPSKAAALALASITPTAPAFAPGGGVDYGYMISNGDLPEATTVDLYWAGGTTPDTEVGDPIATTTTDTAQGTYPLQVSASDIGSAPSGAKYLIAVADPDHLVESGDHITTVTYDPITADSATTTDSKSVTVQYDITEAGIGETIPVEIYRSSSDTFDPSTATEVDQETIPAQDSGGDSSEALGTHTVDIALNNPLKIDPQQEYVFVVVDSNHTIGFDDGTYKEAHFRAFVLGAVSHGFSLFGGLTGLPAWETAAQQDLVNIDKYDQVIAFNWLSQSNAKVAGVTITQGQNLANQIQAAADALVANYGNPGDVVDLQVIGHSRGAVVVSQALLDLELISDPVLNGGYKKMTLLDPHPANNSFASQDYSSGGSLFDNYVAVPIYRSFQATAVDPQVVIPIDVNEAEIYYQHSSALDFSVFNSEGNLNLWGEDPSLIVNYSTAPLTVVNLTDNVDPSLGPIGHSEVPLYYEKYVIQAGLAAS